MIEFSKWLHEVGTGTSSIAQFSRPVSGLVRRKWMDPFFLKKEVLKKKFVDWLKGKQRLNG
jgi:hypothetical protein